MTDEKQPEISKAALAAYIPETTVIENQLQELDNG
jgi:hypothetical protein